MPKPVAQIIPDESEQTTGGPKAIGTVVPDEQYQGTDNMGGADFIGGLQYQHPTTTAYEEQARETGPISAYLTAHGKGLADIARGVGAMEKPGETEKKGYEALQREYPFATGLGEIAGEMSPFLPFGVVAGAVRGVGGRLAAGALTGAAEGVIERRGEGKPLSEQIMAGGLGAGSAIGAEFLIPPLTRKATNLFKKAFGKPPTGALVTAAGEPTAELTEALTKEGLTFDDLKGGMKDLISPTADVAPEQAVRKSFLESQGFKKGAAPTRAQIERTASLFQAQQEAAKTSNVVLGRLENQNALLMNRFDDNISKMAEERLTSGSPVFDHVLNKSTELDNQIGNMYDIAREVTGNQKTISPFEIASKIKDYKADDPLTDGLASTIESAAKRMGLINEKGIWQDMSVEEAEKLIQSINKRYSKKNPNQNRVARILKNAIDDDVTKAGGSDLFKKARAMKAKFHRDIERTAASKFSKRNIAIVQDILEEKIDPDNFIKDGILSKKYRAGDIKDLRGYLAKGTAEQKTQGKKVWDDLRAGVMEYIKDNAFSGPENELGQSVITRARLNKALNKIGDKKLDELFSPAERQFLKDMQQITRYMEPVPGTAIGLGPSAQSVEKLWESMRRRVNKIPILGVLSDIDWDRGASVLKLSKKPLPTPRTPTAAVGLSGEPFLAETERQRELEREQQQQGGVQ